MVPLRATPEQYQPAAVAKLDQFIEVEPGPLTAIIVRHPRLIATVALLPVQPVFEPRGNEHAKPIDLETGGADIQVGVFEKDFFHNLKRHSIKM